MAIYETLSAQTRTIRSNSRSSRIGAFRVRPIRSMFKMRTAPDRSEAVAAEAFRASVRRARLRPVCSAITKIKSLVSKLFRCINPAQKESMNSAGDTIATYCMQTGSQYYTMARFAMHAQCVPVCGNLFHHAVEMLLKGGLARKRPLSDLKDNMGHNLKVLWREFKLEFPDRTLRRHDKTISSLNKFEDIRYPDPIKVPSTGVSADWSGPAGTMTTYGGLQRASHPISLNFRVRSCHLGTHMLPRDAVCCSLSRTLGETRAALGEHLRPQQIVPPYLKCADVCS